MPAEITTQFKTTGAVGAREDLSDIINRIDPDDTPVYSKLKKGTRTAIQFDWQVQELAAAGSNAINEGADVSAYNQTPTERFNNVHAISSKAINVSGTLDAIDTAGRAKESAYQATLKGIELKRDIEYMLMYDTAKSTSDPRSPGTLSTWITNYSLGASATTNGSFDGDGVDFPVTDVTTDTTPADGVADDWGTVRSISGDLVDTVHQAVYNDGGKPTALVLSPTQKRLFSDAMVQASTVVANRMNQTAAEGAAAVGAVDVYVSDFGNLATVIDRFMPAERAYLLDFNHMEFVTLPGRNMVKYDLAKNGDSHREQVLCEWSLEMKAPKAQGAVYALSTS